MTEEELQQIENHLDDIQREYLESLNIPLTCGPEIAGNALGLPTEEDAPGGGEN